MINTMGMVNVCGIMANNMKDNLKTLRCKGKELILGRIARNIRASSLKMYSTAMANFTGLMEPFIKECGKMERCMASVKFIRQTKFSQLNLLMVKKLKQNNNNNSNNNK